MTDEEFLELEASAQSGFASFDTLLAYADALEARIRKSTSSSNEEVAEPPAFVIKAVMNPPPAPVQQHNNYVTQEQLRSALDFIADEVGAAIGKMEALMSQENKHTRDLLEKLRRNLIDKTENEIATLRASVPNKPWKQQRKQRDVKTVQ